MISVSLLLCTYDTLSCLFAFSFPLFSTWCHFDSSDNLILPSSIPLPHHSFQAKQTAEDDWSLLPGLTRHPNAHQNLVIRTAQTLDSKCACFELRILETAILRLKHFAHPLSVSIPCDAWSKRRLLVSSPRYTVYKENLNSSSYCLVNSVKEQSVAGEFLSCSTLNRQDFLSVFNLSL